MKKNIFLLLASFYSFFAVGQNCLQDFQLVKMHRSTVAEISSFLLYENWELSTSEPSEISVNYFGYDIDYRLITWSGSDGSNVYVFHKPGFKNVVIAKQSKYCFNYLFGKLSSMRGLVFQTEQVDNYLIQKVKITPTITVEFRQIVNNSNINFDGGIEYSILVYEKSSFDKELNKAKKKYIELEKQKIDFAAEIEKYFNQINTSLAAEQTDLANEILAKIVIANMRASEIINPNKEDILAKIKTVRQSIMLTEIDGFLAKKDFSIAKERLTTFMNKYGDDDNGSLVEKLESIRTAQIESELEKLMANARDLELRGDYTQALAIYNRISQDFGDVANINSKISEMNSKITSQKLSALRQIVNSAERKNDFRKAIEAQQEILNIIPTISAESKKLTELKELSSLFENRKYQVYDYDVTNRSDLISFNNRLSTSLTNIVNAQKWGDLFLTMKVKFDTSGNNLSDYYARKLSKNELIASLNRESPLTALPASRITRFNVASSYEKQIDLSWNTRRLHLSKYRLSPLSESQYKGDEVAVDYVNKNASFGRYGFTVKDVVYNNELYSYYTLDSYGSVRGPLNAFWSLIIPGLGTVRTSYGEKGWNRLTWVIITGALSYAAKQYSEAEYDNYLKATNQADMDTYFESANNYNYASQGFAALSATIYIGDFLSAFVRGVKNVNSTSTFRKKVRDFPITLNRLKISL